MLDSLIRQPDPEELSLQRPQSRETLEPPQSAESFYLYNPRQGRSRFVPSFDTQLGLMMDSSQMPQGVDRTRLETDARNAYTEFTQEHGDALRRLSERMQYLGIADNIDVSGEGSDMMTGLLKAIKFGRSKNISQEGAPARAVLHKLRVLADGPKIDSPSIQGLDPETEALIQEISQSEVARQYLLSYSDNPEARKIIEWTLRQAVVRQTLPKEAVVPVREIDMKGLEKVQSVGKGDMGETFQASNPLSIWRDPQTGRRFFVKECPEQTLQADYFGLEMLQLVGAPVYDFYMGSVTGADGRPRRVLVTGFLEGYQDPAELLDNDVDPELKKFRLPERFHGNRDIKQALLMELWMAEYNSRAHNFMIHGDSVMHLDQGGCLTSTASGKFKGLSEVISIQDVEDVISCYTDWDFNTREATNEAYAQVAEVIDGKLVIHDTALAERLLRQLESIPDERVDEALERAGYQDGEASIARLHSWIERIDSELMPGYQAKAAENPSNRMDQYIRWAKSARASFEQAISMGGELSYYKHVLRSRKASLAQLWSQAIQDSRPQSA